MDFIKDIDDETIVICNNEIKRIIIGMPYLKPIKIYTLKEFRDNYYFSYDDRTIMFVAREYHVSYEIAHEYIENIYYVKEHGYTNGKLDLLLDIKNKLIDNKLLIYNKYFYNYIKNKPIIIYDTYLDKFHLEMFNGLNYKIIERQFNNYHHEVYEFTKMDDEVFYVAHKIAKLIDNNIDINKIKLTNADPSYYNTFERIFRLFGLKVNIPYKRKLASFTEVKNFIDKYMKSGSIDEALELVPSNCFIYPELIKVINRYLKFDDMDLLIYKLSNSYLNVPKYDKAIEIIDYLDYVSDDSEYIFMLGFNEGLLPKYYMDTFYITDNIVDMVGITSTKELNKLLHKRSLAAIGDIKNLTITYKLMDNSRIYYPSSLCSNFVVNKETENYDVSYSKAYDEIRLGKMYDEYIKYGTADDALAMLDSNYKINYNGYDNKFTGTKIDFNNLYLSYTKMNMYNLCSFRYYLTYILKLDVYLENFSTVIGKLVHYVLEKCLSNNSMDVYKYADEFTRDMELSKRDAFFLHKYTEAIIKLLEHIALEREQMSFDSEKYEEKVDIDIADKIHFTGIIDKLLYTYRNDKTYMAIVDYKTGVADINFDLINNGINMQLPIYMYLMNELDYKNKCFAGIYLQKFDITNNDYKLQGYTNSSPETLEIVDKDYANSKIIKGLKLNNDGSFSRYSKLLSDADFDRLIDITGKQIRRTAKDILDNNFRINPKVYDDKMLGCNYCKFRDICFKKKEDEVVITSDDEILGGE